MTNAGGQRKLPSWIDGFKAFTAGYPSPEILRTWSAIGAIACALERRVWVQSMGIPIYPNLYVLLVAPPGIGKTVSIVQVSHLLRACPNIYVSPTSVTSASLIDALAEAKRSILRPNETPSYIEYHSLATISEELGVLLPAYDNDFMNILTALYDCIPSFEQRRRSRDLHLKIPNVQLNLLAATTPSYMNALMPEGAWDQGFASRVIMIFSAERTIRPLFSALTPFDTSIFADLVHDLKLISGTPQKEGMFGKYEWEPEAAAAMEQWHNAGGPPVPDHTRLVHYVTRRTAHMLKLCMVAAASESNELVIRLRHFQQALDWLIEAEYFMPDIFKSMVVGGDSAAMEEAFRFVYTTYAKEKRPVLEHRIVQFLSQRVPGHSILRLLEVMQRANMIEIAPGGGTAGRMAYVPAARTLHSPGP